MKKAILFMSAVAMLSAISCNKAEVNEPQAETPSVNDAVESLEFVAYTEVETKTTLNGLATEWEAGDNISVNGVNYITNESGSKVIFTKDNEDDINPTAPYIAKYPWCMADESGDMAFYSILDEEGKYEISPDCIADALAVAYSESEAILEFKNVMSLMKFQVPAEFAGITEIRISTTEPLASNILVDYNNGKPTWSIAEGETPSTEIILVTEGSFDPKATYYLPVLPGAKTNLTVRINGYLAATGKSITFERSRIHNVGTLPAPEASGWFLPGAHNGWATDKNALYVDGEYYVAKNVTIAAGGFKFHHKSYGWKGVSSSSVALGEWHKFNGESNIVFSSTTGAYDIYMTKDGSRFQAVAAGSAIPEAPVKNLAKENYLYLNPSMWNVDGARFAAYFFGNGEQWVSLTDPDNDGIYEVEKPTGFTKVIFCRMNGGNSTNDWNNKWNQSGDLTIPTNGNNLFTPSKWDGATTTWTKVTEF